MPFVIEQPLDDLQRLTPSQGVLLYRLIDLGYLTKVQVEELVNRLVTDRFVKAMDYLTFAQQLDANVELHQPHIISRCYYAMYHAARALILHVQRVDVEDHERLAGALGRILDTPHEDLLDRWRKMRNYIDYSPYAPADLANYVAQAVNDAIVVLTMCRHNLINRGVPL